MAHASQCAFRAELGRARSSELPGCGANALTEDGTAFAVLEGVARQAESAGAIGDAKRLVPPRLLEKFVVPTRVDVKLELGLNAGVDVVATLLPPLELPQQAEEDGLF